MRSYVLLIACIPTLLCMNLCRQQETRNHVYMEADSLLRLTLELQSKIGSPEVQRLHDFQEEIGRDLSMLGNLPVTDTSILRYRELYTDLGHCMQACNHYHEEAFMLESSLRDIMDRSLAKESIPPELEEILAFEMDIYNDLSLRIDSSLDQAIRQAGIFYSLKPRIDSIRDKVRLP